MDKFNSWVSENMRMIFVVASFLVTLYIQHITNINNIAELVNKYNELQMKLDNQYQRIDALKLDKSVFEATIQQMTSMRDDIREIRNDLKDALKK